jgi:hypothetical protein
MTEQTENTGQTEQTGEQPEQQKANTFAEMEKEKSSQDNQGVVTETQEQVSVEKEVTADQLSDVAVGDRIKYNRPDLENTEQIVDRLEIKPVDTSVEPSTSQSGTSHFWKVNMILFYKSTNGDDIQNREYISGARAFKQDDGSASPISFWYDGSETQVADLWALVAKMKNKEPKDISPREFHTFWNSQPKVKITKRWEKNFGATQPDAPKKIFKNFPGEILS